MGFIVHHGFEFSSAEISLIWFRQSHSTGCNLLPSPYNQPHRNHTTERINKISTQSPRWTDHVHYILAYSHAACRIMGSKNWCMQAKHCCSASHTVFYSCRLAVQTLPITYSPLISSQHTDVGVCCCTYRCVCPNSHHGPDPSDGALLNLGALFAFRPWRNRASTG